MRTLFEIIDGAKSGEMPTHEECYWAMLALDALHTFDSMALIRLAEGPREFMTPEWEHAESFRRIKLALSKSPKEWVGENNDPANPEYQRRRKIGLKIFEKVSSNLEKKKGKAS